MAITATKLVVGLPFQLGSLELVPDEVQQKAAWSLYVELMTRVSIQPLDLEEGLLRGVLDSFRSLFELTRIVLREAGPGVANGPESVGPVALNVLNKGLRPFTAKWHARLLIHEERRPVGASQWEHERTWEHYEEMRHELMELQAQMRLYANALAEIAGIA